MSALDQTASKRHARMPDVRVRPPSLKNPGRSRISNGSTLLPDVDGRSTWARRVRDLIQLHASDLGGTDHVSEAKRSLIRRAAVLTSELENLELKFAAGESSNQSLDVYQRLTNTLRRVLQTIGLNRVPRDITPSPLDYARCHAEDDE